MLTYKVGDKVRWSREVRMPDDGNQDGIIREVFSNTQDSDDLSLFDVEFGFGFRNLHGSQLELL